MDIKMILKQSYNELAPLSSRWRKEYRLHKHTLNLLDQYIPDLKDKKILDVGCGLGILVHALDNLGAKAEGIDKFILEEWGMEGIEDLWSKKNIKVRVSDFLHAFYEPDTFDVIISEDVFEHLKYTQKEFLDKIYYILKPGGTLILATPNVAGFLKRARMMFGKSPYWDIKDFYLNKQLYGHTREFTGKELEQMAELSGFKPEAVKHHNVYIKKAWLFSYKKYPALFGFLFSTLFKGSRDIVYLVVKKAK